MKAEVRPKRRPGPPYRERPSGEKIGVAAPPRMLGCLFAPRGVFVTLILLLGLLAQPAMAVSEVTEVIVTGTREKGLKAVDSPAPIQVVDVDALLRTGVTDLDHSLAALVPSFQAQSWGGAQANNTLSARLRGLSPNDTLILVDGKRRHGTANLAVLGGVYGSPFQGGAAADLSFIPVSAIDHVEVLTDGAAAQYGSDAIAGVINIILRHDDHGGAVSATAGQYMDEGGQRASVALNLGLKPSDGGFVNLTLESTDRDHSNRGAIDPRIGDFPELVGTTDYPYVNKIEGDGRQHLTVLAVNVGQDLNGDWHAYGFGTYGYKNAESYEQWRTPAKLPGLYPLGFSPTELLLERDFSVTAGVTGPLPGQWNADLSMTYGRDHADVSSVDSANVSLFLDTGATPTALDAGGFAASQWTTNLDLTRDLDLGLHRPVKLSVGFEARHETYEIFEGSAASRYKEGSQAYPGFTSTDAGSHARDAEAAYIDVAASPVAALDVDLSGRVEHYSDFGDTVVGKATARYDISSRFALRGTASTGFRAPTLAEAYYSATNVSPTTAFVQLPPDSLAARDLGVQSLKPEKSRSLSVGAVAHPAPRLTVTLDLYQIDIDNRIIGSGTVYGTGNPQGAQYDSAAALAAIAANGNQLDQTVGQTGVNIFANGANTRTRGADLVLTFNSVLGAAGRIDWSLAGSYNETKVTKVLQTPAEILPQQLFNLNTLSLLQDASPRMKVVLGALWTLGPWSVNAQETIYGRSSDEQLGDNGIWYSSVITPKAITSLSVARRIGTNVELLFGADNLFNIYPNKRNAALLQSYQRAMDPLAVLQYPTFSPFGFNGGYYFGKVTVRF